MSHQRVHYERGCPVEVVIWWGPGNGPRNVLVRRSDGELVVRPFGGLRKDLPARHREGRRTAKIGGCPGPGAVGRVEVRPAG